MVQQPVFWWPACVALRFAAIDSFQLLVNFLASDRFAAIAVSSSCTMNDCSKSMSGQTFDEMLCKTSLNCEGLQLVLDRLLQRRFGTSPP